MKVNTEFKEIKGIGNIPIDWEVKELNDVAIITMGQSPGSENYNDEEIGLPLIQGNADCINRKTSPRVWTSEITKTCEVGDIIMTVRAPAGSISKSIHRSCIGRGVCAIRYKYNTDYLYHYLVKSELHWDKLAQGTTFTAINSRDVNTFNIAVPKNIKDQEKIAQILSNVDMNIEKTEQAIAKYKQVKKGLMDDLLTGKVRIKDGKRFRETNFKYVKGIGKIPWDWEVKKVEDISNVIDSLHQTPIYSDNGYKMIRVNDIETGKLNTTRAYKVSKEVYENFTRKYKPKKWDIILSRVGSYGISCYIDSDEEICLGQNIVIINPFINSLYLYYYLNTNIVGNQISKVVVGSSQKTLSLSNINNLYVSVPLDDEQKQLTEVLYNQDEIIEKEEEYLKKLKQLKLGLMEDLLTGKVRVNID